MLNFLTETKLSSGKNEDTILFFFTVAGKIQTLHNVQNPKYKLFNLKIVMIAKSVSAQVKGKKVISWYFKCRGQFIKPWV